MSSPDSLRSNGCCDLRALRQESFIKWVSCQAFNTFGSNQKLVFEFYTLGCGGIANIAFDADHHPGLKLPVHRVRLSLAVKRHIRMFAT